MKDIETTSAIIRGAALDTCSEMGLQANAERLAFMDEVFRRMISKVSRDDRAHDAALAERAK